MGLLTELIRYCSAVIPNDAVPAGLYAHLGTAHRDSNLPGCIWTLGVIPNRNC